MKRILVIGNGFDLAHKLPTSYEHFLAFCCSLAELGFDKDKREEVKSAVECFFKKYENNQPYIMTFISNIRNNRWIAYFLSKYPNIKKGWINFEKEIENVCLDSLKFTASLEYAPLCDVYKRKYNIENIKVDFKKLIDLLCEYFEIIDSIVPSLYVREVIDFLPNNVINFNYTNILENIYHLTNIDHIHGNVKNKNIILGFNSTGSDENDKNYIEFLKYAQKTINNINPPRYEEFGNDDIFTMFLGHSLDSTDYETIRSVIEKSKIILILYHSINAKKSYISNLIGLFGRFKYDKLTNSSSRKIIFRKIEDPDGLKKYISTYLDTIIFLNKSIKPNDRLDVLNFYNKRVFENNDMKEFMISELANKAINIWCKYKWPRTECENICNELIKKLNSLLDQKKYFTTSNAVEIMMDDIKYNVKHMR